MTPATFFGDAPCPRVRAWANGTVLTIPGFLDPGQCAALRAFTTDADWETQAPITTARGFVSAPDVRNNARLVVDDAAWADQLWSRLGPLFANLVRDLPGIGINERFRFYHYGPGQYFRAHYDGSYRRPGTTEESLFTLMIYLSDVEEGGHTRFFEAEHEVVPEVGLACAFAHRQLHSGEPVVRGDKWVLRTDVMFDLSGVAR